MSDYHKNMRPLIVVFLMAIGGPAMPAADLPATGYLSDSLSERISSITEIRFL